MYYFTGVRYTHTMYSKLSITKDNNRIKRRVIFILSNYNISVVNENTL